ncbi:site-specific integrase [Fodinicurvata fenggangensis]|uniref:site-specific integrase n=1 Tax=Fodinicurvata fenggangensis TaxID=1121830 RepID=UPI00047BF448|nr:site-specific integrase [Fodinicurvata fenggangensis]
MMEPQNLAVIDVRSQVFEDFFPSRGVQLAARRACRRIHEAMGQAPEIIETADIRKTYVENVGATVPRRTRTDEAGALRHIDDLPNLPSELCMRIRQGQATLADAITVARAQPWGRECGRIIGALKRYAETKNRTPEAIPAVERTIKTELAKMSAADFGVTQKSFGTLRARILRGVRAVDFHRHTRLSAAALSGSWRVLTDTVRRDHPELQGDLAKIWSLVDYCWQRNLGPDDVDDSVVQDLLAYLEAHQVEGPFKRTRATVYSWERLQNHVSGWPSAQLSRLYADGNSGRVSAHFVDLPGHTQQLWHAFTAAMRKTDKPEDLADLVPPEDSADPFAGAGLDQSAPDITGSYGETSLKSLRHHWLICVKAHLEETGAYPARLSDVTTRETLTRVVREMDARQAARSKGQTPSRQGIYKKAILTSAIAWARYDLCPEEHINKLQLMRDHVDPHLLGKYTNALGETKRRYEHYKMGARHKERLRQFNDPLAIVTWYNLPECLVTEAKTRLARSDKDLEAMNLALVAVLHRILRCAPLRRRNLAGLRISGPSPQVTLPPAGRGKGRITIEAEQVKNERQIDIELDQEAVSLLRWWIQEVRPLLARSVGAAPDNVFLFPAQGDQHRAKELLNYHFRKTNERHGGFRMNLHLARHLTAKILLDSDPAQMDLVQNLLGHKSRRVTESYYAEVQQILVQRRWHEILDQASQSARLSLKRKGFTS